MNRRDFLGTAGVALTWAANRRQAMAEPAAASETGISTLAGTWAFRFEENKTEAEGWPIAPAEPGKNGWELASVPGCWERDGQPGAKTGPAWYRHDVNVPRTSLTLGARLWWECGAVSYHGEGWASGQPVGQHTGMWDAFAWEIPVSAVGANGTVPLALRVEKPGGKRFPVRETMAGFLPYVWGTWGGPWQDMGLRVTGPCRIESLWGRGDAKGVCHAEAEVNLAPGASGIVRFVLTDSNGQIVAREDVPIKDNGASATLKVPNVRLWNTEDPVLYTLTASALVGGQTSDTKIRRVGFRDIVADGELLRLNGRPFFFRAPLSWGWYENERAPNPGPEKF